MTTPAGTATRIDASTLSSLLQLRPTAAAALVASALGLPAPVAAQPSGTSDGAAASALERPLPRASSPWSAMC